MDLILAYSRLQRRRYEETIATCDKLLQKNSNDEAAWVLKCSALLKQCEIDQLEVQEEAITDILMGDKAAPNTVARVGTSFQASRGANPIMRPTSKSGRVASGYMRPDTSGRQSQSRAGNTNATARGRDKMLNSRAGAITANGRQLRIATASLAQAGDKFFDSDKLDCKNFVKKKRHLCRLVFKYLFHVEHNLKKTVELAAEATQSAGFKDGWWKLALGKCFYHLGFLKDSQKQLLSSVKHKHSVQSYLYLSRVYQKQDQVQKSVDILKEGSKAHPNEVSLLLYLGRIYQQANNIPMSIESYKAALELENCSIEAVASIAAYYFYEDQPQVAAKLYQRLVQLGINSGDVWNNIALCCFYSGKYDLFTICFQRALERTVDDPAAQADVWYNMSNVYVSLGNLEMAEVCLRNGLAKLDIHAECLANLALLEARRGDLNNAITLAEKSYRQGGGFQPIYNLAVWYYRTGNITKSKLYVKEALEIYPQHRESNILNHRLEELLTI